MVRLMIMIYLFKSCDLLLSFLLMVNQAYPMVGNRKSADLPFKIEISPKSQVKLFTSILAFTLKVF